MGKQYQCEYCQRSFRDTLQDRKKHHQSQLHRMNKAQFEFNQLELIVKKFGSQNLNLIFTEPNHIQYLQEILYKRKSCKFHFNDIDGDNNGKITIKNQCRYGLQCKNSHLFTDDQIDHYRQYFLNILHQKMIVDNLNAYYYHNITTTMHRLSKRKLRKELFLNKWIESRFNFVSDKRIDLLAKMLNK